MQAFKRKNVNRIISFVLLCAIFGATNKIITDKLSNVTYGTYFKKDIERIKNNGEQVELLFIGASRAYQAFVPSVFEEKLEYDNVLIASTATQPICGTYYYIKELIDQVHPQKIVIDVTWDRLLNAIEPQPCLLVYDRLSIKNRIPFVLKCFNSSDYKYIFGPTRYRDNLLMYEVIRDEKEKIALKGSDLYDPVNDFYCEKGFIYSHRYYDAGTVPFPVDMECKYADEMIIQENREYLDACIDLCRENGIDVSLVTAPCSLTCMYMVDGYDDAVNWYKNYAKSKGITYYNLNYIRDREEILPDSYVSDLWHVNAQGAMAISSIYAEILSKEQDEDDVSECFYNSLSDLKADVHRVVSVSADIRCESIDEGQTIATISVESLCNEDEGPFYQVELLAEDDSVFVLQEWTRNDIFEIALPVDKGYSIKIRAKTGKAGDKEAYQIYRY